MKLENICISLENEPRIVKTSYNYIKDKVPVKRRKTLDYSSESSIKIEETIKLYLSLNITQTRFELLLKTLKDEGKSPFPSFHSIRENLLKPATGSYQYISTSNGSEIIDGMVANDVKGILKEKIADLYTSEKLVCKIKRNEITLNCCISGDKRLDSTKINLQLETTETNSSVNNLSIFAIWFGSDDRKIMEVFLKKPMEQFDNVVKNGFFMELKRKMFKITMKPFIVSNFLVLYSFFGLKEASSNHNCRICEKMSGGARNRLFIYVSDRHQEFKYRSLTKGNKEKGYRKNPLSSTISCENICIPMLHIFMGLVKDVYGNLCKEMKADTMNGATLITECDHFIKKFNVPYQEYYQTFNGNGVQRFLENI